MPANLLVMVDDKLTNTPVTTQRDRCVDPQEAVSLLKQGLSAVVKGSDMAQFRDLWRSASGAAGN